MHEEPITEVTSKLHESQLSNVLTFSFILSATADDLMELVLRHKADEVRLEAACW